jgi:hypothetical protein
MTMKSLFHRVILTILSLFPAAGLFAQQDVITASANDEGAGGTVSWSLGLVAFSTLTGTSGSLLEGVQQPYEIYIMTGIDDEVQLQKITLFPNPATDIITLKFSEPKLKNFSCQLYDLQGKPLKEVEISSQETIIYLGGISLSNCFIVITENQKPVKIFKIIKK